MLQTPQLVAIASCYSQSSLIFFFFILLCIFHVFSLDLYFIYFFFLQIIFIFFFITCNIHAESHYSIPDMFFSFFFVSSVPQYFAVFICINLSYNILHWIFLCCTNVFVQFSGQSFRSKGNTNNTNKSLVALVFFICMGDTHLFNKLNSLSQVE